MDMITSISLSAPWITYYREVEALFQKDPEVYITFNESTNTIFLYVDNNDKADALAQLLPAIKEFGNITVYTHVVPSNNGPMKTFDTTPSIFEAAFKDNPAFKYVMETPQTFAISLAYIVFAKEVVQFYNDDLGDINGLCSTLYQDIADDVFDKKDGICFCTDTEDLVGKPLGEWP